MKKLPKRHEIEEKYKWKLEDIYKDDDAFEADFKKAEQYCADIAQCAKSIKSASGLKECLDLYEKMFCLVDNLFSYARMRMDEDNANSKYQVLAGRTHELSVKADAASSFVEPTVLTLSEEILKDDKLNKYEKFLDDILRKRVHTLSEKEEKLLAMSQEISSAPDEIFSMLNNADIKFPEIKNEKGETVELTKGRYITFLENKDRKVRKTAFKALYETYGSYKNTLAASYTSNIKNARFYANARGYESSLEAALDNDNINVDVYSNLIDTINNSLPLLHRYIKIRAKVLGLEKINMYDVYVPLVEQDDDKYTFKEACDIVTKSLSGLGEEYTSLLKKGFSSRWIDIYENKGKTSGAYSWGTYMSHPYVLMNYQGTLDNIFTLAHEMGHSLHTYYSTSTQPYIYSRYKIFVAEVASTVNEVLMLKYMLKNTKDKKKTAFLLNHFLESFRGTVFRQTMFAEFERDTHSSYGRGVPLSGDDLCHMYYELNEKYFGDGCEIDKAIEYEWSRIPHFYSNFYVYKYATGFSAAVALVKMMEEEGEKAVKRYIDFLKTGDSKYPLDILKKTGVDLSCPQPIKAGMEMFDGLLGQFEALLQ